MKELSANIKDLDSKVAQVEETLQEKMLRIPNIPHSDVPQGDTDEDNVEVKRWGDQPQFDFNFKAHWT